MAGHTEDVRNGRKAKTVSNEGGLWETAQRCWQKSYAGDYLGLIIMAVAFLFIKMMWEPFHQMFVINDIRIGHPWAEVERVDICTFMVMLSICSLSFSRFC
jgi:diacylglycerol diphosphate phosphatase/phosphatidate phosphatase